MGLKLHVLPAFLLLGIGAGSALAQGDLNVLFAPSAGDAPTRVFTARKILTMEPANPTATAVAVAGDRILAVGSLEEVKKAVADRPGPTSRKAVASLPRLAISPRGRSGGPSPPATCRPRQAIRTAAIAPPRAKSA